MAIPDYQTLMLPVLRLAAEGEIHVAEAVERLSEQFGLTADEQTQLLASGRQTVISNRTHWAKSYLKKAGLINQPRRGVFTITERGKTVLNGAPAKIDNRFLEKFPEFLEFKNAASSTESEPTVASKETLEVDYTPDEIIRAAYRRIEADLASDLLLRVQNSPPAFFERLIVKLLMAMGYGGSITDVDKAIVGGTGDGGVDGVIDQDPLGLDRIYIQAKRYADGNTVGAGAVRDFFGSLDRFKATKGLFVTTSTFSASARETAEMLSKRIVLIDGKQLARLMIRHDVAVRVTETIALKSVDEEFFE